MSKELEALKYLQGNFYIQEDRYSLESLSIIEQALTPPTEEEVCEVLSEYLKEKVTYSKQFGFVSNEGL